MGTSLTRREALHLALMSSENRAAHALGRTYPGGTEAFKSAVKAKIAALGMTPLIAWEGWQAVRGRTCCAD